MASSFPELDALKVQARRVAAVLYPTHDLQELILRFCNGRKVAIALHDTASIGSTDEFTPNEPQFKILATIGAGKCSKKALITAVGQRVYLRGEGGLDELCRQGLVQAVPGGYELTDLGHAILAEQEEET